MNTPIPRNIQTGGLGARQTTLDLVIQLCLFGLAFGFALAHPWAHAYVGEVQFGDAAYWDLGGESWARGYISAKVPDIRPGYSLFLGIIYALSGVDFRHAFVAQALLFGIVVVLVYQIGRHLGGRVAGLMAGLILALNPYMNEWVALSTTEILGSACNLAALYFLLRAVWRPYRISDAVLFGVFLGYANTVRPLTLLFLIPAIPIILLFVNTSWKKRVWLTIGVAGGLALTLSFAVLYQYWATGGGGLSSNTAANFYGASDPKYKTWVPEMYVEVETQLKARGIVPTEANLNAEFWRLTVQNYVQYPLFQLQRIGDGFGKYATFEGELERPDRYIFFRPFLVGSVLLIAAWALAWDKARRLSWRVMATGLLSALMIVPVATFAMVRGLAVLIGLRMLRRRPHPRQVAWGLLASYWVLVGLSQALVGGTEGFFLHRLYTQVEPVNAILIALGVLQLFLIGLPKDIATIRLLNLGVIARRMGQVPMPLHNVGLILRAVVALGIIFGLARLIAANVASPQPELFAAPAAAELDTLGKQLGLPTPIQYIGNSEAFEQALPILTQTDLPQQLTVYVMPGQFSRFIWYVADQYRTEFWFFFANRPRPDSLDRNRLWAEVRGRLDLAEFRDRYGLLVLAPTNAYFILSGDWKLLTLVPARAFVPWDSQRNRFVVEDAVVFPLSILFVDPARVKAATVKGSAGAGGQVIVNSGGPNLRALKFQPSLPVKDSTYKESVMTFPDLEILPGAQFKSFVSLHPRLFGLSNSPPVAVQLWVNSGEQDALVAERALNAKSQVNERMYLPFDADLSRYAGQRINLMLRVVGSAATPDADEVLVGEPQIVMP